MTEAKVERVFWITGARRRARVRLQGSFFVIGRGEPVPVFQDDPQISREHATVVATAAGVRVKDLGSRNGVLVNGKRLDRWAEVTLREGDVLVAGSTEMRLLTAKEAEAPHDGDDLRVDKDGVIRALRLVARAAPAPTLMAERGGKHAEAEAPAAGDEVKELILDPGSGDDLSAEDDPLRTAESLDGDDDGTGALVAPDLDAPALPPDDDLEGEVTSELDAPGPPMAAEDAEGETAGWDADLPTPGLPGKPLEPPGLAEAPTADGRMTTPQSVPAVPDEPTAGWKPEVGGAAKVEDDDEPRTLEPGA